MKIAKTLLAMLAAALIITVFAAEPVEDVRKPESETAEKRDDEAWKKGLISGYKFTPLQVWLDVAHVRLFDADADTVFTFGLLGVDHQKSAALSLSPITLLTDNYGIQLGPLGISAKRNYGISLGLVNILCKNLGLQIGVLLNWSDHSGEQICGVNIADKVLIGILHGKNMDEEGRSSDMEPSFLQIGVFNYSDGTVQIGVLNYNPRSYIRWMPLVNFAMKKDDGK